MQALRHSVVAGAAWCRALVPGAARQGTMRNARRRRQAAIHGPLASMAGRRGIHASLARAGQLVTFSFVEPDGEEIEVECEVGENLLDIAHDNDVEMEGACGGECACSTCHVILHEDLYASLEDEAEINEEEEDMLDLALGLTDTSRLGCQVKVREYFNGAKIRLPEEVESYY